MNLLAPITNLFRPAPERQRDATQRVLEGELKKARIALQEAYQEIQDWQREWDEILGAGNLAGRRGARRQGDSWPLLRNMEDLNRYRTESREACDGNGYGAGMLDRAIDFVIGDGMQPEVTLKGAKKGAVATGVADADGDGRPDADPAVEAVKDIIDRFREANDWGMGEEDREEEGFRRSQRDGEVFVRFFKGKDGIPYVRWVEPEQVDSPPSGLPNERWGLRYKKGDVESVTDIYVYDADRSDGEWVPVGEMVRHKLGTDRTVLRGIPQFWLVAKALDQSDKLNSAMAEVTAIQAQIAYVRQHPPGVLPGQITDFVGGTGDGLGRKPTPYGDKYRRVGFGENGTVVDMSNGMQFEAGPVSQGVPAFVQALQSRLRQVCARFGYPEYFTGDGSNANYASTLVAGGPAERAFKRRQMKYAAFQAAVYKRACEYAVEAGVLSQADLDACDIKVKPGKVTISNNLEEANVDQILIQNKIKSVQTVQAERGLDPRVEAANIEAWDAKFGMGAMGLDGGNGGDDPNADPDDPDGPMLDPAAESYTEAEYQLLSEADRSGLVLKVVGTHPKTGNPIRRYVRAKAKEKPKKDKAVAKGVALERAGELIRKGVKTKAQARELAGHLKTLTTKDIEALKKEHAAKVGGRLKQDKVNQLVAFAQGRGSVPKATAQPPAPQPAATASATAPPAAELEAAVRAEVEAGLLGNATGLVPIHQIRDAVRAKYGDAAASREVFNAIMLDMRREKKLRLISISDRSRATRDQLEKSVYAVGETFFYAEKGDKWPGGRSQPPAAPLLSRPDTDVAAKVLETGESLKYGFGDNKVFVSDLYDELKKDDPSLTEDGFKKRLVDLSRAGHLDLARLDLYQEADPTSLERSEITAGPATFHLVTLPAKPGRKPKANRRDEQ